MSNFDWDKTEEYIKKVIEDAVDTREFDKLNQTISSTINSAVNTFADGIKTAGETLSGENRSYQGQKRKVVERYVPRYSSSTSKPIKVNKKPLFGESPYFAKKTGRKVGGVFMAIIFFILALIFVPMTIDFAITATVGLGGLIFFGGLAFITTFLGIAGIKRVNQVNRFNRYINLIGNKEYVEIDRLAEGTNKSKRFVVRDVSKMIGLGWFKQGRLDTKKANLMVTDNVYENYQKLLIQMEDKRIHEEVEAMRKDASKLDPEVQEILRAGDEYIEKIRESSKGIREVEISEKVARIKVLLERILSRVREKPDTATETRRLMDYYLPITVKLVDAYKELDSQPVQGANIKASKKEIESTLDTLNQAFEKMLDSMFQCTALDLSTDISVLNSMLAKEGLKGSAFERK